MNCSAKEAKDHLFRKDYLCRFSGRPFIINANLDTGFSICHTNGGYQKPDRRE